MNIFITLDSNYIYPLCVMLNSIAETNSGNRIDLYVAYSSLTENDFSDMEKALGMTNHEIHRIPVSDDMFDGCPVLDRISKATYYRLLAGDVLPNDVERVLYLDPDIVINGDLSDFYNLDLQGNIIAGAPHLYGIPEGVNRLRLGLSKENRYINAGVLLIDLKKWREEISLKRIFKFISVNHKKLLLADQDVINALMKNRTLPIDERVYNLDEKTYRHFSSCFAGERKIDLDWVEKNTVIIHFNGKKKPWKEQKYTGRLGDFFEKYKLL